MTKNAYIVRDADGTVIGQFFRNTKPSKPPGWNGEWDVEVVNKNDLNKEPVEWFDDG